MPSPKPASARLGRNFAEHGSPPCRAEADAAVVVATVRALKYNGGVARADLGAENLEAAARPADLLEHIRNMKEVFGLPVVVALNRFVSDTDAELDLIQAACAEEGATVALAEV